MEREEIAKRYGKTYDTSELKAAFDVESFSAPMVRVTRKWDETKGWLQFQHRPRFYFNFQKDV